MLRLDAVDEKVARVSELCVEIDNKIGDQQRRELVACAQTSPISFEAKEIGDVCTQARELATFKEQVTSNLTCTICRDIWSLQVRMAQCCNSILGCDPCVRQWMADNTTYPHCNTDHATTLIFRGLDALIDLIKEWTEVASHFSSDEVNCT